MAMAFTIFVVAVVGVWGVTADQSDCNSVLVTLLPCLDYVTGNASTPSSACCTQLASVVSTQPKCLCEVVHGDAPSIGQAINETLALALPTACKLQTPSVSRCSNASSPMPSPAAVTPNSSSGSGSNSNTESSTSRGNGSGEKTEMQNSRCSVQKEMMKNMREAFLSRGSHLRRHTQSAIPSPRYPLPLSLPLLFLQQSQNHLSLRFSFRCHFRCYSRSVVKNYQTQMK
ncbi:hypothetical protein L6164_034528 [Bauhinia variegata]|uniref:Uncharacterized protein n=1 Tax=Bauhinia variegata TaxID=167791 RepID=A0ACB9KV69_BAUVA|nr:hypothetical protein L6164_034528 [Bauhinia variegata]